MTDIQASDPLVNLMVSLGQAAGADVWLADATGRPLSPFSLLPTFCSLVRQSPTGRTRCEDSYRAALDELADAGLPSISRTCHAGLSFVVAAVSDAADRKAPVLVMGRCLHGSSETNRFEKLAQELGLGLGSLRVATESLPVIPDRRLAAAQAHLDGLMEWDAALRRYKTEATSRRMELAAIAQAGERLGNAPPPGLFLEELAQLAVEMLGGDAGLIWLVDQASGELHISASRGSPDHLEALLAVLEGHHGPRAVLASGEPMMMTSREFGGSVASPPARALPDCVYSIPLKSAGEVLGVLGVTASEPRSPRESMLRFTLLQLLAAQGAVAVRSAALQQELLEKEELTRKLLDATIHAQEEERERICLEIHDGVAQSLVGALHLLEGTSAELGSDSDRVVDMLRRLADLLRGSLREVREIIGGLRPATLDTLGLVATFQQELARLEQELGWETELDSEVQRLSKEMETALYRIVHEAMTNARKHSGTRRLSVRLMLKEEWVMAEVQDWGKGFQWSELPNGRGDRHAIGLLSMRKRAELLGGRCWVTSTPGTGTLVRVELPLPNRSGGSGTDIRSDS